MGRAMAFAVAASIFAIHPASAETLAEALASAYANNPTLNAQRASLRATDEGVPQALAAFRPSMSAGANVGIGHAFGTGATTYPWGASLTVTQPLFTGHRTTNGLKIAETAVLAGREVLRNSEQNTLLQAATAFMDLVQAQAILNLRRENVQFLREQVRASQDRLNVGEGTRTDVAQTEAGLAAAEAGYNAAVASVNTAVATYEQVVGHRPKRLGTARPVDSLLPKTQNAALADAMTSHPSILATSYNIDIAEFNVKVLEGAMMPSLALEGSLTHGSNTGLAAPTTSASAGVRLSVPLFEGGGPSSKVREGKEVLGQRRIELDASRDAVRQAVVSYWGMLDAARAQVRAAEAQVSAQRLVLSGILEERRVGQRTTLDVLNTQQTLQDALAAQVSAHRDRVVASYALLSSIGRLNAQTLGLNVQPYDPTNHYAQVRDKWGGLRTPDGR